MLDNFKKKWEFYVGYVNITDMTYDTFENILPLDFHFKDPQIDLTYVEELSKGIYKFKIEGYENILKLDDFDLYSTPDNSSVRGGKRMIFSSNNLSKVLTHEIKNEFKKYFNNSHTLIDFVNNDFQMVNSVFRLNKFESLDTKFNKHLDTPYIDKTKKLFSKYTMLIYLTGGVCTDEDYGALWFDGLAINRIEPGDVYIFEQQFEHEGRPYDPINGLSNSKIFLRTELIYYISDVSHNEELAKYFNSACYFTKYSKHDPAYSTHANDLFNKVSKIRFQSALNLNQDLNQDLNQVEQKYLIRKLNGYVYVTNGSNYWFSNKHDLKDITIIILIDYFTNDKILTKDYIWPISLIKEILGVSGLFDDEKSLDEFSDAENIVTYQDKKYDICEYYCGIDCDPRTSDTEYVPIYRKYVKKFSEKTKDSTLSLFNDNVVINTKNIKVLENVIPTRYPVNICTKQLILLHVNVLLINCMNLSVELEKLQKHFISLTSHMKTKMVYMY